MCLPSCAHWAFLLSAPLFSLCNKSVRVKRGPQWDSWPNGVSSGAAGEQELWSKFTELAGMLSGQQCVTVYAGRQGTGSCHDGRAATVLRLRPKTPLLLSRELWGNSGKMACYSEIAIYYIHSTTNHSTCDRDCFLCSETISQGYFASACFPISFDAFVYVFFLEYH